MGAIDSQYYSNITLGTCSQMHSNNDNIYSLLNYFKCFKPTCTCVCIRIDNTKAQPCQQMLTIIVNNTLDSNTHVFIAVQLTGL